MLKLDKVPKAPLAIIACVLWASPFVPLKIGLTIYPFPLQFASFRFILAGFFMSLFAGLGKKYFKQVFDNIKIVLLIAIFNTSLLYACFYMGQQRVDGAMGSLVVGSQPLFVVIMAHFWAKNDTFSKKKLFSVALGILGLLIISWPSISPEASLGITYAFGILFLVGNNLSSAASNIMISNVKKDNISPLVLSSSQLFLGGVILFVLSLFFEGGFKQPPMTSEFFICLSILVFISTVAIGIWFVLLSRPNTSVSELNMWKFIIPVVGSIESWLLIEGEEPTIYSLTGLFLLFSSLVFLYWGSFKSFFSKIKQ